jgi:hypothetical protein
MLGWASPCGLHVAGSVPYLARDEALGVQWRNGRVGVYVIVGGIQHLLPEVLAPTLEAARRLVRY